MLPNFHAESSILWAQMSLFLTMAAARAHVLRPATSLHHKVITQSLFYSTSNIPNPPRNPQSSTPQTISETTTDPPARNENPRKNPTKPPTNHLKRYPTGPTNTTNYLAQPPSWEATVYSIWQHPPPKLLMPAPSSERTQTYHRQFRSPAQLSNLIKYERAPEELKQPFLLYAGDPDFRKNGEAYSDVVKRLWKMGAYDAIEEILETLMAIERPLSEDLAARVITLYGRARCPEHAIRTYASLRAVGCVPSTRFFNALITALLYSGKPDMAKEFMDSTGKLNVHPNMTTCGLFIKTLCRLHNYRGAISFLTKMRERDICPDMVCHDTIIDHLISSYTKNMLDNAKAQEIVDALLESCPDSEIHSAIRVRWLCFHGKPLEAFTLYRKMCTQGFSLDSHGFSTLVNALTQSGNISKAKKVFMDALNCLCRATKCYLPLIRCLAASGDVSSVNSVCMEMFRKRWLPNDETLEFVLDFLEKNDKGEQGLARRIKVTIKSRHGESYFEKKFKKSSET